MPGLKKMNSINNNIIPLSVPYLGGNEEKYLIECIRKNFVSSVGSFVIDFEEMLCKETGFKYAVAVSSGTAALHIALLSCDVKKDDLVIIPSYTFIATANAVSHCQAQPWICDISLNDWNLDLDKLRTTLEKETYRDKDNFLRHKVTHQKISAFVPVFCMGMPIDIEKAKNISQNFNIKLVVDAAAGIGAKYENSPIGEMDLDAVTMSFNGNKNITSGGGGVILTNSSKLSEKASHLSKTGKVGSNYDHDCVAFNYRLTNLQAAVGCAQLEQLDKILDKKRAIDRYYRQHIESELVQFFPKIQGRESSAWLSGIFLPKIDLIPLMKELQSKSIESKFFWKPIHLQKPYFNHMKTKVDISEKIWDKILVLPSSVSLTLLDQDKVCKTINNYFKKR